MKEIPDSHMSLAEQEFDYESALLACARGERFALQAIYARDCRWLYSVVFRIVRRRELAEEVLQDGLIRVWNGAGSYTPAQGSARGWIYTVVRNQAINAVRKLKREAPTEQLDDDYLEDQSEPEWLEVEADELSHCLGQLDESKKEAIMLAFVQGYTHEQIAEQMNSPLGSVKSWIRRGLVKLRECLS